MAAPEGAAIQLVRKPIEQPFGGWRSGPALLEEHAVTKVTGELVRLQGAQLQARTIEPDRATDLAVELAAMNEAVSDAARDLDFDDEPADFQRVLLRNSRKEG
jgi:hypothetical protein